MGRENRYSFLLCMPSTFTNKGTTTVNTNYVIKTGFHILLSGRSINALKTVRILNLICKDFISGHLYYETVSFVKFRFE